MTENTCPQDYRRHFISTLTRLVVFTSNLTFAGKYMLPNLLVYFHFQDVHSNESQDFLRTGRQSIRL
jgi:hypothetical protein